ncbi:MAG: protein-methionine-sulfoxide reductase catalytic subunit MsrP [Roseiflexaceae bacterium]|nr:protein-methionine-sulfoxide reductase catalytic subunit MsrP [Roseiflexaceae bacterium]
MQHHRRLWPQIASSEITPEHVYRSRRTFLKLAGISLGAGALAACGAQAATQPQSNTAASATAPVSSLPYGVGTLDELGDAANSVEQITTYNNYYEFSTSKDDVHTLVGAFKTEPWTVTVDGLVGKPQTFDMDDLRTSFDQEERVYRLRCVEGWSMVVPWTGFPLAKLLRAVEPTAAAKYVRFESVMRPEAMPGQNDIFSFQWPYVEALRLDEAMSDLALGVTGLYGKPLPVQNGAPLRLALPWKYGFKSAKAIVKITLTAEQPTTFWNTANAREYGFYGNVNPDVSHPRWSQSSERRIGDMARRRTLKFNGYERSVAALYTNLDLAVNY